MDLDNIVVNENKELLADELIKQRQLQDKILSDKGKSNLYIFNKYILGIEQGKGKVKLAPFHKEMCHFVTDGRDKKKLILIPRNHLKSALVTIGYSVFRIINDSNIRILILSATWQTAVDFISEIKRHLQQNETIHRLFGDLSQGAGEWSADRITLSRTDQNIKGPTVWATGIESNLVGSHPDLIIIDDPHNRDNSQSAEQIKKVIDRYKDTLDLLEPGGQLIVIGTRWAVEDLYGWIQNPENNVSQSFDTMVLKAFEGNIETGEEFQALWPQKFSLKELQTRLREEGWYQFSSQYQNNPVPEEDAKFKQEWFKYYDPTDIRGKNLTKIMTIDPAISLEKGADYTAMIVCGVDEWSNIFILDIWRARVQPAQLIGKIFEMAETWHPNHIGLETVAYQKALAYSLREEMNKRHRYLPISEIQPHERSKDLRIQGLQPLYYNKKVFHYKENPFNYYFEAELKEYPRNQHDDMIDAFSYALDFIHPPRKKTGYYKPKYLY